MKKAYNLLEVVLNFDDGIVYIRSVEKPLISFMMTVDNIINKNKVNEIDGKTSIDNVDPNGLITSIMVSK